MKISQTMFDDAAQYLYTMLDFMRWSATQFERAQLYYGHGTDNPWDEAVALVLQVLHLPPDAPVELFSARLTSQEKLDVLSAVQVRVNERKPLAYATNKSYFCGLEFYVDERTLVPRSPISEMIQSHFEPWLEDRRVGRILDLCTGSGCIAVACADAFPYAHVDATDLSQEALSVATVNRDKHHLHERLELHQADVFEGLPQQKYDIIVSNPPYVDAEDMSDLPLEFTHEPAMGLKAGDDGLDIVHRILKDAHRYLSDHGILVVEVGNSAPALEAAYPQLPFTWVHLEQGGDGVFLLRASDLAVLAD